MDFSLPETASDTIASFLHQLADVYATMDQHYQRVAQIYGFVCRGCEHNCCQTRFYHHTLLEYLYLREGFRKLPPAAQDACQRRAFQQVNAALPASDHHLCPLNVNERCVLYPQRPMICRLHGLPHELHFAHRPAAQGPGCDQFYKDCPQAAYQPFDRTPLYQKMARLEQALRRQLGFTSKLKLTVAEMVVEMGIMNT